MTPRLRRLRLQREEGFTLVELLIAMIVLTIGILALVAAYTSGYVALNRATRTSSEQLIADSQMERFRALNYNNIQLNRTCGTNCAEDTTYTSDSTYSSTAEISGCTTTDTTCLPTQTKTGPDGRSYRLDTYINYGCVSGTLATSPSLTCGTGQPSPVKKVTVVVTSSGGTGTGSSGAVSTREQSSFTSLLGS
ncbi:MAG TPA: prepilin-type N-terminal cleavage/methylation domain-containing protein [Gaiellaceae bacterium]|nr:prepilin-type N-terminal cleavage/methylation domain-containing protein [Gaiellaceae bacterium]